MMPTLGETVIYNSIDGGRYDAKVVGVAAAADINVQASTVVVRVALEIPAPGTHAPVRLSSVRWSADPACKVKQHACPKEISA